jgi:hypothetical protein
LRVFVLTILFVLLTGCAGNKAKEYTRQEWKELTSRTYTEFTQDQLIDAAKLVIERADPEDIRFAWHDNGFTADRSWLQYMIIAAANGVNHVQFLANEQTDGTIHTKLRLGASSGTITASPVIGSQGVIGGASINNTGLGSIPRSIAAMGYGDFTYAVFWKRLDYELGISKEYYTCRQAKLDGKNGVYDYSNTVQYDLFCSDASESITPDGKREIDELRKEETAKKCKKVRNCT